MMPEDPPRVCHECTTSHIENCPECFGFGTWSWNCDGRPSLVTAHDAQTMTNTLALETLPCEFCGSTFQGVSHG